MAMAVADAPAAANNENRKPTPPNLGQLGLGGTLYVILAYLGVAHLVPYLYSNYITATGFGAGFGLLVIVVLAAALAIVVWNRAFPHVAGLRAAVAVGVGNVLIGFLLVYIAGYVLDWMFGRFLGEARPWVGAGFMLALAAWWIMRMVRQFQSPNFPKRMVKVEEGGWFEFEPYKKMQGLRIRRITMLTLMITVGVGIYYYLFLRSRGALYLPTLWSIPFVDAYDLIVFRASGLTIPLLLVGLTLWFGYRLVNYPSFAEFLINTEAEMAKVTWTTRKRLLRDTGVVLLTVLLLSTFLYVLDILWVIILQAIGVLQTK
jgi:preprotein translocase SecE subunit